jgi:hypothetical protein
MRFAFPPYGLLACESFSFPSATWKRVEKIGMTIIKPNQIKFDLKDKI